MALHCRFEEEAETVNMTPMIDIVFNLLIFFLLSSTYLREEQELQLHLPRVSEAAPLTEAPDEIVVNVLADGRIEIAGETMEPRRLVEKLIAARKNYPDQAVAVRGDGAARYDSVAQVLSACRKAGIRRLDAVVIEDPRK